MSGIMLALDVWRPLHQVVVAIFDQRKCTWFVLAVVIVSRSNELC